MQRGAPGPRLSSPQTPPQRVSSARVLPDVKPGLLPPRAERQQHPGAFAWVPSAPRGPENAAQAPAAFGLGFCCFQSSIFIEPVHEASSPSATPPCPRMLQAASRPRTELPGGGCSAQRCRDGATAAPGTAPGAPSPSSLPHPQGYGGGLLMLPAWPPARVGRKTGGGFVQQSCARELLQCPSHCPCTAGVEQTPPRRQTAAMGCPLPQGPLHTFPPWEI